MLCEDILPSVQAVVTPSVVWSPLSSPAVRPFCCLSLCITSVICICSCQTWTDTSPQLTVSEDISTLRVTVTSVAFLQTYAISSSGN